MKFLVLSKENLFWYISESKYIYIQVDKISLVENYIGHVIYVMLCYVMLAYSIGLVYLTNSNLSVVHNNFVEIKINRKK